MIGLIMSLVCFAYSGTILEKILGVLMSFFLGPFYWIYFAYNNNYCGRTIVNGGKRKK